MKDTKHEQRARLDDDEKAAFRAAVRGVRPLHAAPRPARPRPKPRARFARADRVAVLAESLADPRRSAPGGAPHVDPHAQHGDGGESLAYSRGGVPPTVLRKLRRGEYRVDAELDLHGLNARQAETLLAQSLALALSRGDRCVRIVHGKGLRSGQRGPVLRRLVDDFLRRVDAVLAFASAREVDGGSGATLVLLRSAKAAR